MNTNGYEKGFGCIVDKFIAYIYLNNTYNYAKLSFDEGQ
jgi:hypothetical protein